MKHRKLLILSTADDRSTDELIMWARKFGVTKIFRLNDEDILSELRVSLSKKEEEIIINGYETY